MVKPATLAIVYQDVRRSLEHRPALQDVDVLELLVGLGEAHHAFNDASPSGEHALDDRTGQQDVERTQLGMPGVELVSAD